MANARPKRDRKQVYNLSDVLSQLDEDSSGSEYKADEGESDTESVSEDEESLIGEVNNLEGDTETQSVHLSDGKTQGMTSETSAQPNPLDSEKAEQEITASSSNISQLDPHPLTNPLSSSSPSRHDISEGLLDSDLPANDDPQTATENQQPRDHEEGHTDITRGRKRKRETDAWSRNKRKDARNRGREYINEKGRVIHARRPQPFQCKCHYKCTDNIPEDARKKVCEAYWASGDYTRQRDYIVRNVKKTERSRSTTAGESRRQRTYKYHLTMNGQCIQVCKTFFLATLDIRQRTVYYALDAKTNINAANTEGFVSPDRRGKNTPKNKTSDSDKAFLKAHIESFPAVESHYCRQRTRRRYLDSSLNVKKMHELYEEHCRKENRTPAKVHVYREIFNSEYNLGFHKPKKDECSLCDRFKKATLTEKEAMNTEYQAHQARKVQAREHKETDKKRAIENPETVRSINFDLQRFYRHLR
ncbi:uncharacterized protein LOC135464842 [Liolophura sinensis]|uniref:uncharacterized protein LOC135464842 n=1 Tax=Liolophura sinensis TaxID=3198878 RepID=UPI003158DC19